MYAVQPSRYYPKEPNWQDYHRFTGAHLPTHIRAWLLDTGSLTQRLIKVSNNHFKVVVLHQSWQRPRLSEIQLLGMNHRELAIVREVALHCHDQPWVFARSIMPASSLTGRLRHLRHFDNRSLGALLFSDPNMRRHPFQLAMIDADSAAMPATLRQDNTRLWGRRSRFELDDKPIMVSEIFLPGFQP